MDEWDPEQDKAAYETELQQQSPDTQRQNSNNISTRPLAHEIQARIQFLQEHTPHHTTAAEFRSFSSEKKPFMIKIINPVSL